MNKMYKTEVPAAPHDESIFLGNLASAMESLNHIIYWAGEYVDGRMSYDDFLVNVQRLAASAKSIPARNCDTMDNFEMLSKRFKEEVCYQYDNDWEDPRTQCSHDCIRCVMEWMLAKKESMIERR